MGAQLSLSIIIPAYNEGARFGKTLDELALSLPAPRETEVIVVDDGSTDATARVALDHVRGLPHASVVRLPINRGKGAAVKLGVAMARGDVILFMDADLATDLADMEALLAALADADVAIGSRTMPGAVISGVSDGRRLMSRAFRTVVHGVFRLPVTDTQCGFKAFPAPVAKLLFHLTRTDGFAFDVEILTLAHRLGYRIAEVPVHWHARSGSTVKVYDPAMMVVDVLRSRWRHRGVRVAKRLEMFTPTSPVRVLRLDEAKETKVASRSCPA